MDIVVYNLGCKVNQYESDALIKALSERGHSVYDNLRFADIYILNSCAVTNEAERKSRQAISRCKKYNPDANIIVCGCASENDPRQFVGKDGVTYVSGVADKAAIPDLLDIRAVEVKPLPKTYEDDFAINNIRTRAFLKVQDGCNNYCSYCLIPYVRGRSRSRQIDSAVREAERLASLTGEIVLTGINLSAYGEDIGSSLTELMDSLRHIDTRIRLGSLEVNVIDREFLSVAASLKRFCPQFHLSLQSGDNEVLKAMNRHYTTEEYYEKVKLIREYYPDAAITTDLICGFPTETERQAENTLKFIESVGFSDMHVFVYSVRGGTKAAILPQLDTDIRKRRAAEVEKIADAMRKEYLYKMLGKPQEVLVEKGSGYSREYVKVYTDGNEGEIKTVFPEAIYKNGVK